VDFAEREPIDLATSAPNINCQKIWIDAGQDDPRLQRDESLQHNLNTPCIIDKLNILAGSHNGDYWIPNVPLYLRFYDSQQART
jgi:hypothetical protein